MLEPRAAVDRALARAVEDPTQAARDLLSDLFDGKRLAKDQQAALSAIAERTVALRMGTAPAGDRVPAAEALGDNWFQCPHCAEVFEGEVPACTACGKLLAVARRALELDLGDARLWLRASSGDRRRSDAEVLRIEWMRVEAGGRWFELLDEPGRRATMAALTANAALPPNVSAVGARDGDRTLLVHATKLEVHVVERGVPRADGGRMSATELAVRELISVLYPDATPDAPSAQALAEKGHTRNSTLEAAILADPDRPEAYLVYADWLQVQGDPRGELIVLQHANQVVPANRLLASRAAHFYGRVAGALHQLERHRFDPLGRDTTWRWGFLESLWISAKQTNEDAEIDVPGALAALLDHPSSRFLRDLTLGIVRFEDNSYDEVAAVIGNRRLPALRSLILGDFYSSETELNWSHMGDVSPIYRAVPDLRSLTLRSGSMQLGPIELPTLHELTILTGGLDLDSLRAICRAPWPNLTTLALQLGNEAAFTIDHLAPVLDGRGLPRVTHLGLGNSTISDAIAGALARSAIAAQLVRLDLSKGTLGDAGARALAAGSFPKLERVDVGDSFLTDDGIAALSRIAKHVEVGEQHDDHGDPGNRFISARE